VRRTVPALIVLAAVAGAALTGCSASSQASADCTVSSGTASDSVRVSGTFGEAPQATVPSPLNTAHTQSTTLITGKGPRVSAGGAARLAVTIYDGQTGQQSQQTQSGYFPVDPSQISKGLAHALECATEGSRIAVVIPQSDGGDMFGGQGSAVVIVDVEQALPNRATGRVRPATPGFPTVVLAPNGQPGIVIGAHQEPTKVSSAVLKQGDGKKVTEKDTLIVQTQTVTWADPTTATGSWEQSAPGTQTLSDKSAISSQLIGKTVGSQVIVLVPKAKAEDGQSAATVVDILGVIPASASAQ
jgi:peptidylprolyl isomerase